MITEVNSLSEMMPIIGILIWRDFIILIGPIIGIFIFRIGFLSISRVVFCYEKLVCIKN